MTFELVTPAYAGSAVPGHTDGLRPPTLKGLLRFWWRALHAALPLPELAEREARIFGSTGTGQGLVVVPLQSGPTGAVEPRGQVVPGQHEWHWYSAYGAVSWDRDRRAQVTQVARMMPSQHLSFRLMMGPVVRDRCEALREVAHAAWLLSTLGGFGMRSRRGWGSLQLTEPIDDLPCLRACRSREDVVGKLADALHVLCPEPVADLPDYTALNTRSMILVGPSQVSWEEALKAIIKPYRTLRRHLGAEHNHSRTGAPVGRDFDLMEGYRSEPPEPEKGTLTEGSAFGLPHNYQFSSGSHRKLNVEVALGRGDDDETGGYSSGRRASPLMFKVVRTSIPKRPFVPVVAWLPARFISGEHHLVLNCEVAENVWKQRQLLPGGEPAEHHGAIPIFLSDRTETMTVYAGRDRRKGTVKFTGLRKRGWRAVPWP
ncbi:MAG: type III-B CRISPR module RAMP protein Cmr1 [Armatimonadota bacterium]|nr:type III-B CRISPR module RAMP protein Cmr1 [Armatimonadota bacterium]